MRADQVDGLLNPPNTQENHEVAVTSKSVQVDKPAEYQPVEKGQTPQTHVDDEGDSTARAEHLVVEFSVASVFQQALSILVKNIVPLGLLSLSIFLLIGLLETLIFGFVLAAGFYEAPRFLQILPSLLLGNFFIRCTGIWNFPGVLAAIA